MYWGDCVGVVSVEGGIGVNSLSFFAISLPIIP